MQQIADAESLGAAIQIGAIEPFPLHADDPKDVPPLAIGHFSSASIPPQLLEQDVLRAVHIEAGITVADVDFHPSIEQVRVQIRSTGNEYVDLDRGNKVDQVGGRPLLNRPHKGVMVDIEGIL